MDHHFLAAEFGRRRTLWQRISPDDAATWVCRAPPAAWPAEPTPRGSAEVALVDLDDDRREGACRQALGQWTHPLAASIAGEYWILRTPSVAGSPFIVGVLESGRGN